MRRPPSQPSLHVICDGQSGKSAISAESVAKVVIALMGYWDPTTPAAAARIADTIDRPTTVAPTPPPKPQPAAPAKTTSTKATSAKAAAANSPTAPMAAKPVVTPKSTTPPAAKPKAP